MKIFVSYRRNDVGHVAGRLRDRLVSEFGEPNVFFDVDSIDPGQRFVDVTLERLGQAEVVLVLIGPNWQPQRLARPGDYVRLELAEALDQQKRVVPVLVDDAVLPIIDDLPRELTSFLAHNAAKLRQDPDFHQDAKRLIEGFKPSLAQTSTRPSMTQRSKAFRPMVTLGGALLLALLVWLAMQALRGQNDDNSSTDDLPACEKPDDTWAQVELAADPKDEIVDDDGHLIGYEVLEAAILVDSVDSARLVVQVAATNRSAPEEVGNIFHYYYYYAEIDGLFVDGVHFETDCFGPVTGSQELGPAERAIAWTGFATTGVPTGATLVIQLNNGARIDIGTSP